MIDILIPNVQAWVESAIKSLRTGRDVRSIVLSTIKVSVGAYTRRFTKLLDTRQTLTHAERLEERVPAWG